MPWGHAVLLCLLCISLTPVDTHILQVREQEHPKLTAMYFGFVARNQIRHGFPSLPYFAHGCVVLRVWWVCLQSGFCGAPSRSRLAHSGQPQAIPGLPGKPKLHRAGRRRGRMFGLLRQLKSGPSTASDSFQSLFFPEEHQTNQEGAIRLSMGNHDLDFTCVQGRQEGGRMPGV